MSATPKNDAAPAKPMPWTGQADIRMQVEKLWQRGQVLSALATGEPLFPKRLLFKGPTSAEISADFDAVRLWNKQVRALRHCRVLTREFGHRVFGVNSLPIEVWIDSIDDAAALIGRRRELDTFASLFALTRERQPRLMAWLGKRALRALELADEWPRLLDVVAWMAAHPRPGLFLRQVDIAGVDSKFIENRRAVLAELFDAALPPEAIDAATSAGAGQFAQRYGFRDKAARVRFRFLDPAFGYCALGQDLTIDAQYFSSHFAAMEAKPRRVFITENEINFLSFPPCRDSVLIFGAGYGFDMLRDAAWLDASRLLYWGDIDTHGFAILDQLRSHFAHAESFLMDRATLMAFQSLWGEEDKPCTRNLPHLSADEGALYDDLRDSRLPGPHRQVRLEQERIGFDWVRAGLKAVAAADRAG
jgi:hypothetical protein